MLALGLALPARLAPGLTLSLAMGLAMGLATTTSLGSGSSTGTGCGRGGHSGFYIERRDSYHAGLSGNKGGPTRRAFGFT